MKNLKEQFGARIKEIREERGISQENLAEIVGMESRHISRIETGKSFTTIENIQKIAQALNINMDMLFSFKHKNSREFIEKDILNYLNKADDKQLELVYKLILNVFN